LSPHLLGPEELILRAHNADLLQFGHVLVTLGTALLVVVAVHFMNLLDRTSSAWAGLVGGALAILGAIILAADKGALCLTMTALDTVPADKFSLMMPGLLAMFSHKGWLVLLWGITLLPLGFAIQAVGLLKTGAIPHWQSALFLVGVLFVGFPDGAEIVNLTASILMTVALVPYGIRMLATLGVEGRSATAAPLGFREASPAAVASSLTIGRACRGCRRTSCSGCRRALKTAGLAGSTARPGVPPTA
jgi:hypothetical protein